MSPEAAVCTERGCPYPPATGDARCLYHLRMFTPESLDDMAPAVIDDAAEAPAVKNVLAGKPLGRQEARLVALVAEGLTNKEIAQRMVLSEGTVKTYLVRAMAKLSLTGRPRYQIIALHWQWHWQDRVTELERRLATYEVIGTS